MNPDGTSLTVVTPPGGPGPVDVTVLLPGDDVTAPDGFTYEPAPPRIDTVTPGQGPTDGGTTVTVGGSGFVPGRTTVTICGTAIPASQVTWHPAAVISHGRPTRYGIRQARSDSLTTIDQQCVGSGADVRSGFRHRLIDACGRAAHCYTFQTVRKGSGLRQTCVHRNDATGAGSEDRKQLRGQYGSIVDRDGDCGRLRDNLPIGDLPRAAVALPGVSEMTLQTSGFRGTTPR
ncbi:IPT/TIG domain-containing protein [Micromonospora matsumotoense]|uniref:IPT/TIG domain-containing protein n=1 Tax=Micromonospora matsumotoense TaxID=121616 RepID=UPI0033C533D9